MFLTPSLPVNISCFKSCLITCLANVQPSPIIISGFIDPFPPIVKYGNLNAKKNHKKFQIVSKWYWGNLLTASEGRFAPKDINGCTWEIFLQLQILWLCTWLVTELVTELVGLALTSNWNSPEGTVSKKKCRTAECGAESVKAVSSYLFLGHYFSFFFILFFFHSLVVFPL